MPNNKPALDATIQALADPTRRRVIERLSCGPISVSELAKPFGMALPSFMQHLRLLERSGLIRTHKEGRVRTCEIVTQPLEEIAAWLANQRALWTTRLDQFDAYVTTIDGKE